MSTKPSGGLPPRERPVEKLLLHGAASLGVTELIAILLGVGCRGRSVHEAAVALYQTAGGLQGLRGMSTHEMTALPGIGRTKAARVAAAVELGRRAAGALPGGDGPVRSSRDVHARLGAALSCDDRERFLVLGLSSKNRVVIEHRAAEGCLNECPVSPRDVFGPLLKCPAASAILVHNHPSGDPSPSSEDRLLTIRMAEAGRLLGIKVLDHVIVGAGRYYSFRDDGALS
jgi:DNA repair protein RadC